MRFGIFRLLTCLTILAASVASGAGAHEAVPETQSVVRHDSAIVPTRDRRKIAVAGAPLAASASHTSVVHQTAQVDAALQPSSVAPLIRFRVKLTSPVDGAVAKVGDPIHGELLNTVVMPNGTIIGSGAHVLGEITEIDLKKSSLKADFSKKHWRNCNGVVSMRITKVANHDIPVDVIPAPKSRVERINPKAVSLGVDGRGEITVQYSSIGYTAAGAAVSGASLAAGPVGWVVGPVLGGAAGAVDPTFAYGRPVTEDDKHSRMKGFFKGVIGGLPGGFFISGATNHGINISLEPGDIVTFQERQVNLQPISQK